MRDRRTVGWKMSDDALPTSIPERRDANIYFKNVDYDVADQTLIELFRTVGDVISLHVVRDSKGRSRGFGFMGYIQYEHAQRAISELNGRLVGRKAIVVMPHVRKEERPERPVRDMTLKEENFAFQRAVMPNNDSDGILRSMLAPPRPPRNETDERDINITRQMMMQYGGNAVGSDLYRRMAQTQNEMKPKLRAEYSLPPADLYGKIQAQQAGFDRHFDLYLHQSRSTGRPSSQRDMQGHLEKPSPQHQYIREQENRLRSMQFRHALESEMPMDHQLYGRLHAAELIRQRATGNLTSRDLDSLMDCDRSRQHSSRNQPLSYLLPSNNSLGSGNAGGGVSGAIDLDGSSIFQKISQSSQSQHSSDYLNALPQSHQRPSEAWDLASERDIFVGNSDAHDSTRGMDGVSYQSSLWKESESASLFLGRSIETVPPSSTHLFHHQLWEASTLDGGSSGPAGGGSAGIGTSPGSMIHGTSPVNELGDSFVRVSGNNARERVKPAIGSSSACSDPLLKMIVKEKLLEMISVHSDLFAEAMTAKLFESGSREKIEVVLRSSTAELASHHNVDLAADALDVLHLGPINFPSSSSSSSTIFTSSEK